MASVPSHIIRALQDIAQEPDGLLMGRTPRAMLEGCQRGLIVRTATPDGLLHRLTAAGMAALERKEAHDV